MSSYHGNDTAKIMEQLRRDTKKKQSRGAGARSQAEVKIDLKEVAKFVPRHLEAELTADTASVLCRWQNDQPHFVPIGAKIMYESIRNGITVKSTGTESVNETHKVVVKLVGRDAGFVGCDGREVAITSEGFASTDGKELPLDIWSVTIRCNVGGDGTPVFGHRVGFDKDYKTGKRNILTVH